MNSTRLAIDPTTVRVEDDYYFGNAYTVQREDGPVVRVPEHNLLIVAETIRGELYVYNTPLGFGPHKQYRAERLVLDIKKEGSIHPNKWTFVRNVYGTQAYVDECSEMSPRELAGESEWYYDKHFS